MCDALALACSGIVGMPIGKMIVGTVPSIFKTRPKIPNPEIGITATKGRRKETIRREVVLDKRGRPIGLRKLKPRWPHR
jgi:hypothetical protein